MKELDDRQPRRGPDPWRFAGIGIQLGVTFIAGAGLGYWLDTVLLTSPWLLLGGTLLGFSAGMYNLLKAVR